MLTVLWVYYFTASPNSIIHDLFNLAKYMFPEINVEMWDGLIQMLLIFLK